jgi:hypothetical protein
MPVKFGRRLALTASLLSCSFLFACTLFWTLERPDVDLPLSSRIEFDVLSVALPLSEDGPGDFVSRATVLASSTAFSDWLDVEMANLDVDARDAFERTFENFGDDFFEENALVIVDLWVESGSIEASVWRVCLDAETVTVAIQYRIPSSRTDDMRFRRLALTCRTDGAAVTEAAVLKP